MSYLLNGLRVLDMTRVLAGPWCTQMLADFGAEVIKVEMPDGGDDTRKVPPFFPNSGPRNELGEPTGPDLASFYVTTNRGKKSVVVDISSAAGQEAIQELVKSCDVFMENFKVGNLARFGMDYATLSAINPKLIYCSITGYGQSGPLAAQPGYDVLFQGISGAMSTCGLPDSEAGGGPMRTLVPYTDLMTGLYACNGVLAAIMHRNATGEGQYIDLALIDVAMAANSYIGSAYLATGRSQPRIGNSGVAASPSGAYPCVDGFVIIQCNHRHWAPLCDALGQPEWKADARFVLLADRITNAAALDEMIKAVTRPFHKRDLVARVAGAGVPCVPVNTIAEAFAEPQVAHRELVVHLPLPNGATLPVIRNPLRFSKTQLTMGAPPYHGAHTREIMGARVADASNRCSKTAEAL